MGLLLLFQGGGQAATFDCWTAVATTTLDWTVGNYDFFNVWNEWGTTTWAAIATTGLTWAGMAGFTFAVSTTTPTTWSVVTVTACSSVC